MEFGWWEAETLTGVIWKLKLVDYESRDRGDTWGIFYFQIGRVLGVLGVSSDIITTLPKSVALITVK